MLNRTEAPKPGATESIRAKLQAGPKLMPSELTYLQSHAPDLYSKAVRAEQERYAYESSLRQSQSKEEVRGLYTRKMLMLAGSLKRGDAEEAGIRMSAIREANMSFTQSGDHARLDRRF